MNENKVSETEISLAKENEKNKYGQNSLLGSRDQNE